MFSNSAEWCVIITFLLTLDLPTRAQQIFSYGQCISQTGEFSLCIDLYQCGFIKNMLIKVPLSEDEKLFAQQSQCGYTNGTILVWCSKRYLNESQIINGSNEIFQCPAINDLLNKETVITYTAPTLEVTQKENVINYGCCITPNGERASCVKLSRCPAIYDLLKKVNMSSDEISYSRSSQCGYTNGSVLVCCPDRYLGTQHMDTHRDNCPNTNVSLPEPGTCGYVISDRVTGGNITEIDEFPWLAFIEFVDNVKNVSSHLCGGSLINARYILSAAHCFTSSTKIAKRVRLGEWNTMTDQDCIEDTQGHRYCADPHIDVRIDKIITHGNFNSRSRTNDIALVRLSDSVAYTDFIQPICLPPDEKIKPNKYEQTVADVAGWGRVENGSMSNIKLKAALPILSLNDCKLFYKSYGVQVYETQLCAGGEVGVDTCKGDSGGPLIGLDYSNKSQAHYFLTGITSFGGLPCGRGPGLYTKVNEYTDWIKKNILATEYLVS